ncbi:bifunctional methylenetetrahydrofolate dehydrogenase/methenyltetrahydrofolate cyclohydrolase FolD [Candidatus Woesearchaeota archaeon]|nr:bifunctional methylenetetrahydrofolate dehydrogenase/methenyltetrahydrofolate cyclohydrolase FolD [Candidatus Woesearchaeota archaeon]
MTARTIDGKTIAKEVRSKIKKEVHKIKDKIGLAVILVGDNPASKLYVNMKQKACKEVGMDSYKYEFQKNISEEEVLSIIKTLNKDKKIHGILVQLPVPDHIDEKKIIHAINPDKDVDCFHTENVGEMFIEPDYEKILPATPKGVIKLIESTGIDIKGKNAVVVGRSNIVGKPVGMLLLQKHATVTYCHSRTKNLKEHTKYADILIAAVGRHELIKADMVKKGAVVIDVGINKVGAKVVGDVDFNKVKKVAAYITPVPFGVGPMTIAMLLENTLIAYKRQNS